MSFLAFRTVNRAARASENRDMKTAIGKGAAVNATHVMAVVKTANAMAKVATRPFLIPKMNMLQFLWRP